MVNWAQVAATAALSTAVSRTVDRAVQDREQHSGESEATAPATVVTDGSDEEEQAMNDKIQELIDIQRTNDAPPEALDAYAGTTLTIPDGGTGTVEVTPGDGFNLHVAKLYMDRRQNTSYTFYVGGIPISQNHQADFTRPRRVSQGGKVVAEAVNNSGGPIEIDFEMDAWALAPEHE